MPWAPASSSKAGSKKKSGGATGAKCHVASAGPPHLRQHGLRPPAAFRRKYARSDGTEKKTHALICWQENEPLSLPSQKHGSIFSPHWPVDFCAPKRLVFGFAACGAWVCRLRHLSFACACACLALELFVLVFVLFACGARTSSVQTMLASLASVHRRRQNSSNTQLFISYRSAAAPKAARISCCCWQIVWFAVCLFTAGGLRCHLVKQPLPAALDTGAGGAGVGVATPSGASRCRYL